MVFLRSAVVCCVPIAHIIPALLRRAAGLCTASLMLSLSLSLGRKWRTTEWEGQPGRTVMVQWEVLRTPTIIVRDGRCSWRSTRRSTR